MGHRTLTFDEPEEPDTPGTEEKKSTESPVNELELRLLNLRRWTHDSVFASPYHSRLRAHALAWREHPSGGSRH